MQTALLKKGQDAITKLTVWADVCWLRSQAPHMDQGLVPESFEMCNRLPLEAALARQILSFPAASAKSERRFSKVGQIVSDCPIRRAAHVYIHHVVYGGV